MNNKDWFDLIWFDITATVPKAELHFELLSSKIKKYLFHHQVLFNF